MGNCMIRTAVPVQRAIAPCSSASHRLESLSSGGDLPFCAEREGVETDNWLVAFGAQAELGEGIEVCINDLHVNVILVSTDVSSNTWVKPECRSAVTWNVWAPAGMGEAAMPVQAGTANCGKALDWLVRLAWSVRTSWVAGD